MNRAASPALAHGQPGSSLVAGHAGRNTPHDPPRAESRARNGWSKGVLPLALTCWLLASHLCTLAAPGLTGEYYDTESFSTLKFTRVDPRIDFDFDNGSPTNAIAPDTFSIRWSGQLEPAFTETYTFYVTADDGARLWVNDRLVLARTTYSLTALELSGQLKLEAGQRYNLVLEFIERSGNARVALEWASPSLPREVIPAARLFPTPQTPDRGTVRLEHWGNLPGTNVATLTTHSNYPARPDFREQLASLECLQRDWSDGYGARVSGWLVAPAEGMYEFAVASASAAHLYLSSTTGSAGLRLVASNTVPVGFRDFTARSGQVSAGISLQAHQKYYFELLHKAGEGADHFSVGWRRSGETTFTVIPGAVLVPGGSERPLPGAAGINDTLAAGHPRLLASPMRFAWLKGTVASNTIPQLTSWWQSYSNSAASVLSQPVSVYDKDVRGTILGTSRAVMDRIYKLATVWRMNGDTNFAERAWQELNQVASTNFPDWHPAHFLDTAEMTHACAIGYDWLHAYWSPGRRTIIREAIINKGLKPSLSFYTNTSSWVAASANNWNLVCNGGMALGALAVADENEGMSEYIIAQATASVNAVMGHYTTDNGGWYEGPGYWDYTTEYNTRLVAALESALGSDFGLNRIKGFAETGLNPIYMVGPTRLSFNYADAGAGNMRGPQLFYLARRFNRPEYGWHERANATVEALDLLWYDARGTDPRTAALPPDNYFRGPSGTGSYYPADAITLRTRWQDSRATFAGFKAGEIGASHGNLDAGSFVLDASAMRWAHDLGGDDYALRDYFGSQRWNYYRLRAEGHNTLIINPTSAADQRVGQKPPVILFASDSERAVAVADLTSAAQNVSRHWRGVKLFAGRRWFMVQDEVVTATPATAWWFMHFHTNTTAAISPGGTAVTLAQGAERLWITNLTGGGVFTISNAVPLPSSPNPAGQNANLSFRKLALRLTGVTNQTLCVLMVPLSPGESPPASVPAVTPLNDWGLPGQAAEVGVSNTPPTALATNVFVETTVPVLIDLRRLGNDRETPNSNLVYSVAGAVGGAVSLMPDGFTARFAPGAGFNGTGSFAYSVLDSWPDARLVAAYTFEPPEEVLDGFVTDYSGNGFFGEITTVGTGTNYLVAYVPPALTSRSAQAWLVREAGDFNGARLKAPVREADLDFNNQSWTVSFWLNRATTSNDDFVFYLGASDGFGSPDELQLYGPSGKSQLVLRHYIGNATTDADIVTSLPIGQWSHAAVVFNPTNGNPGSLTLYLNGALVAADTSVALNLPSGRLPYFGGHASTGFAVTRWFSGFLDDIGIFSAALELGEITQLATQPLACLGGTMATNGVRILLPARPLLSLASGAGGGTLSLSVSGSPNLTYAVLASTNLTLWDPVHIATNPPMPFIYHAPSDPTHPARYYRVQVWP